MATRPQATAYLRTALEFLSTVAEEELKRIPILGGAAAALRKLSEEVEKQEGAAKIDRLLDLGQQTEENIQALTGLSTALVHYQGQLLSYLQARDSPLEPHGIESVGLATALIAYRNRVAYEYS